MNWLIYYTRELKNNNMYPFNSKFNNIMLFLVPGVFIILLLLLYLQAKIDKLGCGPIHYCCPGYIYSTYFDTQRPCNFPGGKYLTTTFKYYCNVANCVFIIWDHYILPENCSQV